MTFLEWCLKAPDDDRLLHITTSEGKEYLPGEAVYVEELNHLKPMKVVGRPKLENDVWQIRLEVR